MSIDREIVRAKKRRRSAVIVWRLMLNEPGLESVLFTGMDGTLSVIDTCWISLMGRSDVGEATSQGVESLNSSDMDRKRWTSSSSIVSVDAIKPNSCLISPRLREVRLRPEKFWVIEWGECECDSVFLPILDWSALDRTCWLVSMKCSGIYSLLYLSPCKVERREETLGVWIVNLIRRNEGGEHAELQEKMKKCVSSQAGPNFWARFSRFPKIPRKAGATKTVENFPTTDFFPQCQKTSSLEIAIEPFGFIEVL